MCSRILKQALHGLVVHSLGCLHGQEKAVRAAIRIALPERNEVAEGGHPPKPGQWLRVLRQRRGGQQARWCQVVWPWFFILFGLVAATQGGGSVAAMAGFCWMLAVNLVQDSASHMRCVMA